MSKKRGKDWLSERVEALQAGEVATVTAEEVNEIGGELSVRARCCNIGLRKKATFSVAAMPGDRGSRPMKVTRTDAAEDKGEQIF